eukprot:359160-Chlamydomonas_euryale.AAC.1
MQEGWQPCRRVERARLQVPAWTPVNLPIFESTSPRLTGKHLPTAPACTSIDAAERAHTLARTWTPLPFQFLSLPLAPYRAHTSLLASLPNMHTSP